MISNTAKFVNCTVTICNAIGQLKEIQRDLQREFPADYDKVKTIEECVEDLTLIVADIREMRHSVEKPHTDTPLPEAK
jgi:DNA-directed RNA polymerase sigma subunit (sigma70/sigma32)